MTSLANLVTALALVAAAVALVTTRSWRTAIRLLLDLLTAAGLIRLAGPQNLVTLVTAAAIIALRQLVSATLLRAGPVVRFRSRSRAGSGTGAGGWGWRDRPDRYGGRRGRSGGDGTSRPVPR